MSNLIYESEESIKHPSRLLICGRAGSGKTFLSVDIILRLLAPQVDRIIAVCPTWSTQTIFRKLDHLVNKERDIFESLNEGTFTNIFKQLLRQNKLAKENGANPIKTLILVDDCGSTNAIHGGRVSPFGHLSIQLRHLGASSIVIVQNPKLVSPNYRENITGFISFPTQRKDEMMWINNEFNGTLASSQLFNRLIQCAWNGASDKEEEQGKHFLYITCPPRDKMRYYSDFHKELKIDEIK